MSLTCIIGKLNRLNQMAESYVTMRLQRDQIPVLRSHLPLFYILPADGAQMRFQELVDRWGASKSTISEIVAKYEHLGLLEKCVCGEDKRNVFIAMKPEAIALKKQFEGIEQDFLEHILANLSESERNQFSAYLESAIVTGAGGPYCCSK